MSSYQYFDIVPFDPMVEPSPQIVLPIDWDEVAAQLKALCPTGRIVTGSTDGEKFLHLYITHEKFGEWIVATLMEGYSVLAVSYWPKNLSKQIVLWYRNYIPLSYPLFSVIPEDGYIVELTSDLNSDNIERLYPFPVSED